MPPQFANLIKTGLQLYTTLSFICPRDGKKKGVYQWKRGDQTPILPVLLLVDAMLTVHSVERTGKIRFHEIRERSVEKKRYRGDRFAISRDLEKPC